VNGERQLITINYQDPDWPNGYVEHLKALQQTILDGGYALGAFDGERLIGIATLNRAEFGIQFKHVLFDQLFVSLEYRGKGVGKELFRYCVTQARKWMVDKIYICAGSAEETIAFYYAIGCIEAVKINQALYDEDPNDLQLEYTLI
jgi:GNAT superfamily N-acetyltransferase